MDEQGLVAAAQRGDVQAFNTLVLTYQTMAFNVAYRVMHDEAAAADATQEAFISAYRGLHGFRGGSFKAWVLRIVVNACYDQLRLSKRRPTSSLDEMLVDPDHSDILDDHSETPEEYVLRQDVAQAIQAGLDALPADQRAMVVLSDVQGLSYEEIAQATGVNLGTVKSRLSRGRARMREFLLRKRELEPAMRRLTDG